MVLLNVLTIDILIQAKLIVEITIIFQLDLVQDFEGKLDVIRLVAHQQIIIEAFAIEAMRLLPHQLEHWLNKLPKIRSLLVLLKISEYFPYVILR